MKKCLVIFFMLALVCISASARKSYITVYCVNESGSVSSYNSISMTGDVPENIEGFYYDSDYHAWISKGYQSSNIKRLYSVGEILNVLSEYGYEVELGDGNHYLLSKEIPSNQTIIEGDVNNDGEVTISDVNKVVNIILGIIRENPSLLEQYGK